MPIIKSAKKRVKVANKAAVRNSKTRRSLKTSLKLFAKKSDSTSQSKVQSELDKATKKGLMHKNKANRLKRQLAAKAKAAGVKPTAKPKKTVTKPAAARKPAVKKAPAKK